MTMRSYKLLFAAIALSANAWGQTGAADSVQHITLDTLTIAATAGKPVYRAAATRVWDIVHTRIALSFNRKAKTASAREWIKLHPYSYATDTLVLDAKSMKIDSVQLVVKGKSVLLSYVYANDLLKIRMDRQYKATDTITLQLQYTAMPYAEKSVGSSAITEDRGLYFINTDGRSPNKPAHIWTQGETESNSHWLITIDKPNTRFTTQLELTVPDTLVTLSNGALASQLKLQGGMRTDIWKMDKPIQAYAVMFAIGKYSVVKDKWNGKEVNYYVEPEFAPYARDMFARTTEMLGFFSAKTGVSYPWNKYSQVVVRDYVSGAMENTSASLFGEFMNLTPRELADKNNDDIVAHELFHQWFGDYVTCESWSNLTVNESFANYGEQLWRNWKYGPVSADELAWNDLQGYIGVSRGKDPELVRFYYDDKEEMFDAISYNKGGAILHYLHTLIGDAAFEQAMKIYLTRNALSSAEAHNWRQAVEAATGQDWNWFFDQWYYHAGHPVLKVTYNYNDTLQQLSVDVTQTQDDSAMIYDLPLETTVLYGKEHKEEHWRIKSKSAHFVYPYRNGVKPVPVPDNRHVLPGELKENKKPVHWLVQLQQCNDYVSRRLAVQGAAKQMSDSAAQELLDLALENDMASIRRYALEQIDRASSDRYRKRWTATIMKMASTDADRSVRAAAYEVLGDWKVAAARTALLQGVRDSSYAAAGNALEALNVIDKDTAYLVAKELLKTKPAGALATAIWTIIGSKGADEDTALLQEKSSHIFGSKTMGMAAILNNYLKNVVADASFQKVAAMYADRVILETMRSYRSAAGGYMFQNVAVQNSSLKQAKQTADTTAIAKANARLAILKTELQRVIANEQDEELKGKFAKMLKEKFEQE